MHRLEESPVASGELTDMRTGDDGDVTRPLTSNVIDEGAETNVRPASMELRELMFSPLEATAQPEPHVLLVFVMVTLALRLSASLRARSRSAVRSYASDLTRWVAANERMPGEAIAAITAITATSVSSSTSVKPRLPHAPLCSSMAITSTRTLRPFWCRFG